MKTYCTGYLDIKCKSCKHCHNNNLLNNMMNEIKIIKKHNMEKINIEKCVVTNFSEFKQKDKEIKYAIST